MSTIYIKNNKTENMIKTIKEWNTLSLIVCVRDPKQPNSIKKNSVSLFFVFVFRINHISRRLRFY